jgi:putative ABC transport system substrate-binding protein
MRRRQFIAALSGAALAWPLGVRAQQTRKGRRIGFLRYPSPQDHHFAAFQQGLRDLGHSVGEDLLIEERYARGRPEQLPLLAAELARLDLDLVVVDGTPTALAARQAMPRTPIIFVLAADPIHDGLAASLARPGGNLTGLTFLATDLTAKRLQLLKEAIPGVARVGVLYNPRLGFSPAMLGEVQRAGPHLGLQVEEAPADRPEALAGAFAAAARLDALLTLNDGMFFAQRTRIVELTLQHRLPALHPEREYVEAGGLMSYGPSLADLFRRAASYVDRILRGAKPGDLPIQQPTKFELIVNLRTAKTLGLALPESIPLRADEVIE